MGRRVEWRAWGVNMGRERGSLRVRVTKGGRAGVMLILTVRTGWAGSSAAIALMTTSNCCLTAPAESASSVGSFALALMMAQDFDDQMQGVELHRSAHGPSTIP